MTKDIKLRVQPQSGHTPISVCAHSQSTRPSSGWVCLDSLIAMLLCYDARRVRGGVRVHAGLGSNGM